MEHFTPARTEASSSETNLTTLPELSLGVPSTTSPTHGTTQSGASAPSNPTLAGLGSFQLPSESAAHSTTFTSFSQYPSVDIQSFRDLPDEMILDPAVWAASVHALVVQHRQLFHDEIALISLAKDVHPPPCTAATARTLARELIDGNSTDEDAAATLAKAEASAAQLRVSMPPSSSYHPFGAASASATSSTPAPAPSLPPPPSIPPPQLPNNLLSTAPPASAPPPPQSTSTAQLFGGAFGDSSVTPPSLISPPPPSQASHTHLAPPTISNWSSSNHSVRIQPSAEAGAFVPPTRAAQPLSSAAALPCLADAAAAADSIQEYRALLTRLVPGRRAVVEPVVSAAAQQHGDNPLSIATAVNNLLDTHPTLDGATFASAATRLIQIGARPLDAIGQIGHDFVSEQRRLSSAIQSHAQSVAELNRAGLSSFATSHAPPPPAAPLCSAPIYSTPYPGPAPFAPPSGTAPSFPPTTPAALYASAFPTAPTTAAPPTPAAHATNAFNPFAAPDLFVPPTTAAPRYTVAPTAPVSDADMETYQLAHSLGFVGFWFIPEWFVSVVAQQGTRRYVRQNTSSAVSILRTCADIERGRIRRREKTDSAARRTSVQAELREGLDHPATPQGCTQYGQWRSNINNILLKYYFDSGLISQSAIEAANDTLSIYISAALLVLTLQPHHAQLTIVKTERNGHQGILEAQGCMDSAFVVADSSEIRAEFNKRSWEVGTSAHAFLLSLSAPARVQGMSDSDVLDFWATAVRAARNDNNGDHINALIDDFISRRDGATVSSMLTDLQKRTAGTKPLVGAQPSRGRGTANVTEGVGNLTLSSPATQAIPPQALPYSPYPYQYPPQSATQPSPPTQYLSLPVQTPPVAPPPPSLANPPATALQCQPADPSAAMAAVPPPALGASAFAGFGQRPPSYRRIHNLKMVPGAMQLDSILSSNRVPNFVGIKRGPLVNLRTETGLYGLDCCFCAKFWNDPTGVREMTLSQYLENHPPISAENPTPKDVCILHTEPTCRLGWMKLWSFVDVDPAKHVDIIATDPDHRAAFRAAAQAAGKTPPQPPAKKTGS